MLSLWVMLLQRKLENYLAVDILQSATGNDITLGTDNQVTSAKLREGLQKMLDAGHDYADGETFLYASPAAYMYLLSLRISMIPLVEVMSRILTYLVE